MRSSSSPSSGGASRPIRRRGRGGQRRGRSVIESFAETYGYTNALLFDPDGNTAVPAHARPGSRAEPPDRPAASDSELAEVFDRVRTLLQVDLSDYQVYPGRTEPAAFIAGPVYDTQGRIVGYRGAGAGQPRGLPDRLNDYNGLGETGEAVVASRGRRTRSWFISPSRTTRTGS